MTKLSLRRDKVFCHECRFCCTLSICTNREGTYFRNSEDKPLNGSKNKVFYLIFRKHFYLFFYQLKAVNAATGYLIDMRMYKYPDYRCLKPKPGLPSSQWPHYDMEQHRVAKSIEELNKVEEIPFNKESSYCIWLIAINHIWSLDFCPFLQNRIMKVL